MRWRASYEWRRRELMRERGAPALCGGNAKNEKEVIIYTIMFNAHARFTLFVHAISHLFSYVYAAI